MFLLNFSDYIKRGVIMKSVGIISFYFLLCNYTISFSTTEYDKQVVHEAIAYSQESEPTRTEQREHEYGESDTTDVTKASEQPEGLPLFYWKANKFTNFGDYLSLKLVERIVGQPIRESNNYSKERKLLAIGSIFWFAHNNDVVWGSGVKRDNILDTQYKFKKLDVRAVRGPLTREFLIRNFRIKCPKIYGDPALLVPYFFPEFKRKKNPKYEYIIIPHYSEEVLFPKSEYSNAVYPSEPWNEVIEKITDSKLVISGSLHGIIVAEAFGVPARLLRKVKKIEPMFKYADYYEGTGRPYFQIAYSIEQALEMGGEKPIQCDLKKLYDAFPFEFWPHATFIAPDFTRSVGEQHEDDSQ